MKKIRLFFNKITKKYKLVFLSANSLEERFSFFINRLYVFYALLCFFIICAAACWALFWFTPISGYFNTNNNLIERADFEKLMHYTDSLSIEYKKLYQWTDNLKNIAIGEVIPPKKDSLQGDGLRPNIVNLNDGISEAESSLRDYVEHEDDVLNSFHFKRPTNGFVTDTFNVASNHYGVDIATNKLEKIFAVLNGEVFISGQNEEYGNFMIINHPENIMSIYMHADSFTKKGGDVVNGGELIGYTGNTGTLSNGTHLHFELKHNGKNVNPEKYILF